MIAARSVVAHARGVHGVTFDPFHERRLATYSEDGIVKLWDMRRLVEPVSFFFLSIFFLKK